MKIIFSIFIVLLINSILLNFINSMRLKGIGKIQSESGKRIFEFGSTSTKTQIKNNQKKKNECDDRVYPTIEIQSKLIRYYESLFPDFAIAREQAENTKKGKNILDRIDTLQLEVFMFN